MKAIHDVLYADPVIFSIDIHDNFNSYTSDDPEIIR